METWKLPILLVADKKYLETLQSGKLFMKNSFYYQRIENNDTQRGDVYDSAIPSNLFELPDTKNGRLTFLELRVPPRSAVNLKEISQSTDGYALLIYDTEKFVNRFVESCKKCDLRYCFFDVDYIETEQYLATEQAIVNMIKTGKGSAENPIFLKRKKYEAQQEFRIAINCPERLHLNDELHTMPIENAVTIEMKPIYDISVILNVEDIIDNPYVLIKGESSCVK